MIYIIREIQDSSEKGLTGYVEDITRCTEQHISCALPCAGTKPAEYALL